VIPAEASRYAWKARRALLYRLLPGYASRAKAASDVVVRAHAPAFAAGWRPFSHEQQVARPQACPVCKGLLAAL
jgi:hypothetical protein